MPKRLPLSRRALRALSLDQLVELDGFVRQLLQSAKEGEKRQNSRKQEVVEEKVRDHKTYRQILVRCGKDVCRCAKGTGHGPYWYAFWSESGQTKCKYIGKKSPQVDSAFKGDKRRKK